MPTDPAHLYSLPAMAALTGVEELVGTVNHVTAKASLATLKTYFQSGLITSIPDQTINIQTGSNYTLALTDKNNAVGMNVAGANTITVPQDSSVNFPTGSRVDVFQAGSGATTLAYSAPVVVHNANGLTFGVQWAGGTLLKMGPNEWVAFGGFSGTATPASAMGTLLAYKMYQPAADGQAYNTTSGASVDIDATNLVVSFTVPASGVVIVALSGSSYISTNALHRWMLREGSSDVPNSAKYVNNNPNIVSAHQRIVVSGLTPGASKTYKWGWNINSGTAYLYGGPTYGQFLMEVFSA